MIAYVANKVGFVFLTLFGVASLVFFLFTVLPGDPAQMMLDQNDLIFLFHNSIFII